MVDLSIQKPIISILPGAVDVLGAKGVGEPTLQAAGDVVTQFNYGGNRIEPFSKPALRAAVTTNSAKSVEEQGDVGKAIEGFQGLLAKLMVMMLQLEKADSERIKSSSNRETVLAKAQANSTLKLGDNSLGWSIGKAALGAGLTAAGTWISVKGFNRQLGSTRANQLASRQNQHHLSTVSANANDKVKRVLGIDSSLQSNAHEATMIVGSKLHAYGSAINQMSAVSSAVIEGAQSSSAAVANASKEIVAGDASVQGRQTDVDIKARSRDENIKADLLSTMKSVMQAQSDVMSHIAQNTRV